MQGCCTIVFIICMIILIKHAIKLHLQIKGTQLMPSVFYLDFYGFK